MSGTWKDRKMYFMKQLWNNTDICFYDGNYGFTVPSWFKKMQRQKRRNKIKQEIRNGNYDCLPKWRKENMYLWW